MNRQCEFFLLRWSPDALRQEFVNVGVAVMEEASGFADLRFTRDLRRARCLDPDLDVEFFEALEAELRARLRDETDRAVLMKRLPDWASNALQLSPATAVLTDSPEAELARLADLYLERRRRSARDRSGRAVILNAMRDAFAQAGVWELMRKRIPAGDYTHRGDPLRIDCGYRPNGVIRMFHAVSLDAGADAAKVLAFSYPALREGLARIENAKSELTAIVADDVDPNEDVNAFALATLKRAEIRVAATSELPDLAERGRRELHI